MAAEPKEQRIRDPVHGLIVFSKNSFDQLIWRLINTREFQRLRRIKQLGFSELVYPGATHTRFAHCVGVFHTARTLVAAIRRILQSRQEDFDEERANIAVCAALLHDVGHGPFSHAFESVPITPKRSHEKWTVEIIKGDTEIARELDRFKELQGLSEKVATLLSQEPTDIYASIVSSQFDADRLDYLRRDKMMTGTEQGGFDWDWLLNNLEVDKVVVGDEDQKYSEVDGLVLGKKSISAAEGYLVGRYHLYRQVYLHKTTRAAEKMLGTLLSRLMSVLRTEPENSGLPDRHPMRRFFSDNGQTIQNFLALDDFVIWGSLSLLGSGTNPDLQELSNRLQARDLYKCEDVGAAASPRGDDSEVRFRAKLNEARKSGDFASLDVLEDTPKVSPYGYYEYASREAFKKVLIRTADGRCVDIKKESKVVEALGEEKLYRVYGRSPAVMNRLCDIGKEGGLWT